MQWWTALVFLAIVAVAVAALVVGRRAPDGAASGSGANVVLATSASSLLAKPELATVPTAPPRDVGSDVAAAPDSAGPRDPAPSSSSLLGAAAPRSVTFGVVLVTYRGAQGASPDSRSHDEALALAEKVSAKAAADFAAAVKLGDLGFEDAGEMPRDVLEPPVEAALFGLKPGEVSAPVDSPRGYYVFRRIE
jgi:parvulin-like peptidyl-prolyl isomerase